MYKPLPVDGAPPCRVVIKAAPGTDPGALQQAYVRLLGPINHFYAKAVQTVGLSDLPQVGLQQTIPGAKLRYVHNNGQQMIQVELTVPNPQPTRNREVVPLKKSRGFLAIDVVADANYFRSMVVNAQVGMVNSDIARDSYTRGVLAGAVVDSSSNPISALSWGRAYPGMPSAAPGLRQISDNSTPELIAVDRTFPAAPEDDPTHPFSLTLPSGDQTIEGATPLGFLVDLEGLGTQGALTIKIYLASISQRFVYDLTGGGDVQQLFRTQVGCRIRARELNPDIDPKLVTVNYTGEYNELYTNPEAENKFPETITSGFYVEPDWVDLGGAEVSNPTAQGMGELLAQTVRIERTVTGKVDPALDFSYPTLDGALWTEPVTDMTLVATVDWVPSEVPGVPGTASITLA